MGSCGNSGNMHSLSDESGVKEESMKPSQDVASSTGERADEFPEVDLLSSSKSYDSHSHSESSAFRASNAPEDMNNVFKTVSKDSSPKNAVCSNKSDLTEISSLRNSVLAKNEEQVESSLQGTQATRLVDLVQPHDGEKKGDVAENCLDQKECSVQSIIVPGGEEKPGVSVQAIDVEVNDGSQASELEVHICDICGDLGREKLLAICSKCGDGAEHIYCMSAKLEEVPENWVCEDCVTTEKDGKQKEDINGKEESPNATGRELQCGNNGSLRGLDFKDEELSSGRNQKDKADPCFLVERCENSSETPSADQRRSSRKRKHTLSGDCSVNEFVKAKMMEAGVVSSGVGLPELQKRSVGHSSANASAKAWLSSAFDNCGVNERVPASQKHVNNGQNCSRNDVPTILYDPSNGSIHLGGTPSMAPFKFHIFPLPYSIWQGRFKLQRNGIFSSFRSGIQAHLSRAASQNCFTLAPRFSPDIVLEEESRSTVWTTQFSSSRAFAENIHIYFFPKDPESFESSYKCLLEYMIVNDVYLKGNVAGFELLIFSSNMLEENFQRWNGLFFLWGVFRDPTLVSFSSRAYSHCPQEQTAEFSRLKTPQVPGESLLVNFLQVRGRTFQEHSKLPGQAQANSGCHSSSSAPNLELSLGLGGASTRTGHLKKLQPVSSGNIHGDAPSLSLSLSLSQPFSREEALRVDPVMMEQEDAEKPETDTTLSPCS